MAGFLNRVRRPHGAGLVAVIVIPVLVVAAGVVALARSGGSVGDTAVAEGLPVSRSDTPVLDPATVKKDAAALVQRTPKELPTQRLAKDVVPPTNRWYSGLVFGPKAQPVFPLPLGFVLKDNGFAFGVPRIESGAKGVVGSAPTDVSVTVDGVTSGVVTRTDDLSVTVELRDASGAPLARVTIAQGDPVGHPPGGGEDPARDDARTQRCRPRGLGREPVLRSGHRRRERRRHERVGEGGWPGHLVRRARRRRREDDGRSRHADHLRPGGPRGRTRSRRRPRSPGPGPPARLGSSWRCPTRSPDSATVSPATWAPSPRCTARSRSAAVRR